MVNFMLFSVDGFHFVLLVALYVFDTTVVSSSSSSFFFFFFFVTCKLEFLDFGSCCFLWGFVVIGCCWGCLFFFFFFFFFLGGRGGGEGGLFV